LKLYQERGERGGVSSEEVVVEVVVVVVVVVVAKRQGSCSEEGRTERERGDRWQVQGWELMVVAAWWWL